MNNGKNVRATTKANGPVLLINFRSERCGFIELELCDAWALNEDIRIKMGPGCRKIFGSHVFVPKIEGN